MLRIDDIDTLVWVPHEETGTRYQIRAIEPKDAKRLLKEARDKKTGELDNVKYNGLAAEFMIAAWDGVGDSNGASFCAEEAKIKFGERFGRIVAFLMDRATDMKMFRDEADAGKND